jgi:hypothetical protein
MQLIRLITTALFLLFSGATAQQYTFTGSAGTIPCLGDAESYLIALRWLQIFQTNAKGVGIGGAIIDSTIAPNFTYYDEGASLGKPRPVYDGKASLVKSISGTGYSGTVVTDVHYTILTAFASCDTSVVRWQSNSKAANGTGV